MPWYHRDVAAAARDLYRGEVRLAKIREEISNCTLKIDTTTIANSADRNEVNACLAALEARLQAENNVHAAKVAGYSDVFELHFHNLGQDLSVIECSSLDEIYCVYALRKYGGFPDRSVVIERSIASEEMSIAAQSLNVPMRLIDKEEEAAKEDPDEVIKRDIQTWKQLNESWRSRK